MIRLANVLIVDADHARADALEARLAKLGFYAAVTDGGRDARHAADVEHPDMMLIGHPNDGDALVLGRDLRARPETADIPLLLLVPEVTPEIAAEACEAGFDDVLALGCDEVELTARLRPLGRLATMHGELRHRAAAASRFGIDARHRAEAPRDARPAVLVVGDRGDPVRSVLAGEAEIAATATLYEAEDLLTRTNYDAAVVSFDEDPPGLPGFCAQVRNNPRLFNLPLLVMSRAPAADLLRSGATRVLAPDGDARFLRSAAMTLVHRQQLRWSIRAALGDTLAGATRDEETGAYNRAFLDSYLEDRLNTALSLDRHLTVAFFNAPSVAGVRAEFGDDAGRHLLLQLAQWIGGLVRAEDLVARTGEYEFCVVLPDTPLAEAEVVMHRIAGVLAYTDFAVHEVYQPVKLWVQVGAADARTGDTLEALTGRARQSLG